MAGHGDAYLQLPFQPTLQTLTSAYTSNDKKPTTLTWSNVSFADKTKTLLSNVSGRAEPGRITALLGPAKSGKTALVAMLAGRVGVFGKQEMQGSIKVNGSAVAPAYMREFLAGFVHKHDTVLRSDTVRQAVRFAVGLRSLNYKLDNQENLVNDLISSFGLIPNTQVAKLSKMHRKLLSIAMELAALPSLLFLDEPTAALDVESAWIVVRVLRHVAETLNIPVILALSQPTGEVFAECADMILLSQGRVAYSGPSSDLEAGLEHLGFPLPAKTSPSDFMLMAARTAKMQQALEGGSSSSSASTKVDEYATVADGGTMAITKPRGWACLRFFGEVWVLFKREIRANARRVRTLVLICILALLLGGLFVNGADQASTAYSFGAQFAGLVLVSLASSFVQCISFGLQLCAERPVFIHERSSGLYSSVAYLLAKLMVELPLNFFFASVWYLITYFMVGWQGRLIYFIAVEFFVLEICTSMVYLFSSLFPVAEVGMGLVPAVLGPQLLFMGTFVRVESLTPVLRWVPNLCFLKYAVNLLAVEEFNTPCLPAYCPTWEALLASDDFVSANVWWYALVMGAFVVFFRVSGSLVLANRARKAALTGIA
jgi:ABC-type multidrug transport system ATPase subunit